MDTPHTRDLVVAKAVLARGISHIFVELWDASERMYAWVTKDKHRALFDSRDVSILASDIDKYASVVSTAAVDMSTVAFQRFAECEEPPRFGYNIMSQLAVDTMREIQRTVHSHMVKRRELSLKICLGVDDVEDERAESTNLHAGIFLDVAEMAPELLQRNPGGYVTLSTRDAPIRRTFEEISSSLAIHTINKVGYAVGSEFQATTIWCSVDSCPQTDHSILNGRSIAYGQTIKTDSGDRRFPGDGESPGLCKCLGARL